MSSLRKLPRRIGDVPKFDKTVRLTHSVKEGATQTSRFVLVSKIGFRGMWTLANPDTGIVYVAKFKPRNLVKDVFMTNAYRASRGFYPLKTSTKENS
jgi:hypothetical protein